MVQLLVGLVVGAVAAVVSPKVYTWVAKDVTKAEAVVKKEEVAVANTVYTKL